MTLEELVNALADKAGGGWGDDMASVRINSDGVCFLSVGMHDHSAMDIHELEWELEN